MVEDSNGVPGLRRSRAHLDAVARLTVGDVTDAATVLDVSMSGVRMRTPGGLQLRPGQVVDVSIEARGRRTPVVPAHVVRVGPTEMALAFGPLGMLAERELGWIIERFGELHEGTAR